MQTVESHGVRTGKAIGWWTAALAGVAVLCGGANASVQDRAAASAGLTKLQLMEATVAMCVPACSTLLHCF